VVVPEELEPATVEPKVTELICGNRQGTPPGLKYSIHFL